MGVRSAYRLGYPKDSIETFTESVWAQLPGPDLQFAIDDAQPNPIVGRLRVQLSIPDAGPARVELFDTRGRRLATRDVSSLGPGEHLVDVGDGLQLQSGIYFVRATWRDRIARARFVILQ